MSENTQDSNVFNDETPGLKILKVKSTSNVNKVAGAAAEMLRAGNKVELHAIGAASVNQALKATAIARGYVAANGLDLKFIPGFIEVTIGEEKRTGMKIVIVQ